MTEGRGMRGGARGITEFFGEVLHRSALHSADTQSAAIAFYTLFSLAPVLLVTVSIVGHLFGEGHVYGAIVRQVRGVMGPDVGHAVSAVLRKASGPGPGASAGGIAGSVAFVLGTTAVFLQLQEALNRVWEVAPLPGPMLRSMLKRRLVSFALVLAAGSLLLVSLTLSAGLMALTGVLATRIPLPVALVTLGNELLSFLVLTVLIALVYRVLPDANLDWQDVGIGAVVTSTLFSIGKWLIGLYLGWTSLASSFGVAGSLVVFLLWVYCQSYVLLFGAEVTAVYSSRYRRQPVRPEAGATTARTPAGRDAT